MPAKDVYHETVKNALVKDGWTITHDPYRMKFEQRSAFVDLGAERLLGAEKNEQKIAVEIKRFLSDSELYDLEITLGQFVFYRALLKQHEPERKLFVAVTLDILDTLLSEPIAIPPLEDLRIPIIAFDPEREVVVRWKT